jgi:ribosomal-protein-alanine N-acetyltransferase
MSHDQVHSHTSLLPSTGLSSPFFEDVKTLRLDLVPVTAESLHCQARNAADMRAELGAILHAKVPDAWPHENWEPHVLDYLLNLIAADSEAVGWCRYLMLRHPDGSKRTLIGSFGSGFPKPETGQAEIGYGILPQWQRQGFAVEAVAAMLPWLQERREIQAFVAQTFPHLYGSIRVLEKCGFQPAGAGFEEGTILFRRECAPVPGGG